MRHESNASCNTVDLSEVLDKFFVFLFFDRSDLRPYPGIQIWDPGPQIPLHETGSKFQISKCQGFGWPMATSAKAGVTSGLAGRNDILNY